MIEKTTFNCKLIRQKYLAVPKWNAQFQLNIDSQEWLDNSINIKIPAINKWSQRVKRNKSTIATLSRERSLNTRLETKHKINGRNQTQCFTSIVSDSSRLCADDPARPPSSPCTSSSCADGSHSEGCWPDCDTWRSSKGCWRQRARNLEFSLFDCLFVRLVSQQRKKRAMVNQCGFRKTIKSLRDKLGIKMIGMTHKATSTFERNMNDQTGTQWWSIYLEQ